MLYDVEWSGFVCLSFTKIDEYNNTNTKREYGNTNQSKHMWNMACTPDFTVGQAKYRQGDRQHKHTHKYIQT